MTDNKQATLALGTKPVGQLLWQYALPAIVAMSASSLYNIIDRAMIGQIVGPEAIAGLGITFPECSIRRCSGCGIECQHQCEIGTEGLSYGSEPAR